jgi:hypothetical protein
MGQMNSIEELLDLLAAVAIEGPIKAVGTGDKAVGITLLDRLGIAQSSLAKSSYKGLVVTARRGRRAGPANRVNLFAQVPDWSMSACRSSKEILEAYGYSDSSGARLNCSVSARKPNSQGLMLEVDQGKQLLHESAVKNGKLLGVATWSLAGLEARLVKARPESVWVTAIPHVRDDGEYFHYRYASYTGKPRPHLFGPLLDQGTITMDHLISDVQGRVIEKGPLFKINPANLSALFANSRTYDLLSL